MRTPQQWWLDVDIPDGWQPKVLSDQWIQSLVEALTYIHKKTAEQLGINIQKMDKRLGWVKSPAEREVGDQVLHWKFAEQDHPLGMKWEGPVHVVENASPTVYQVETWSKRLNMPKLKWFHSSPLKPWKGDSKQ